MLRNANTTAPSLAVAALLFGLASPAFADVPPRDPVEQPEVEPPKPETPPPPQPDAKSDAKSEAKAATKDKSGNCSVDTRSDDALGGIAALVMLIAGAGLLRFSKAER